MISALAEAGPGCPNPGWEDCRGCWEGVPEGATFELSVEGLGGDIQVGMGCICVWSEAVCFRLKERWAKARRCEPLWPVGGTRSNSIWWECRTGCRGSESEAGGTPVP